MTNAWNVTEAEFEEAKRRHADAANVSNDQANDYWQLIRFYNGWVFIRDEAERALQLIRKSPVPRGWDRIEA